MFWRNLVVNEGTCSTLRCDMSSIKLEKKIAPPCCFSMMAVNSSRTLVLILRSGCQIISQMLINNHKENVRGA